MIAQAYVRERDHAISRARRLANAHVVASLVMNPTKEVAMKYLAVVLFASACAGAVQVERAPVVPRARGTHVVDHDARCNLSWLERSIDYNVSCTSVSRR